MKAGNWFRAAMIPVLIIALCGVAGATTVVVNPSNMDGWAFYITSPDGIGSFVVGPATPPLGVGSARFFTGTHGDERIELRNTNYSGTLLSSLTALGFSTYATSWNGQQVPYLMLNIDWDGDGVVDDNIFFEPPYQTPASGNSALPNQGDAVLNTWQTWNALVGGWWSNNWGGMTPGTGVQSLATYIAAFPNASIVNSSTGLGGVRLIYGWASLEDVFNGYVDKVTINSTTYDFDVVTPVHNITQSTNYMTIQAAINTANPGDTINVDAGTYPGTVDVSRAVAIYGAGQAYTTITQSLTMTAPDGLQRMELHNLTVSTTDGPYIGDTRYAIRIDATGGNTAPVTLQNVTARMHDPVSTVYGAGVFVTANGNVIDDVQIIGCTVDDSYTEGLFIKNSAGNTGTVSNVVLTNSTFDDNDQKGGISDYGFGIYILASNANPSLIVDGLTVTNCTFNGNYRKGMYIEALKNAQFDHVTATGSGREGIDLNLKWDDYQTFTFQHCSLTGNNTTSGGYPDLHIKGRNDGGTYSLNPASVSGVQVTRSAIGLASFGNNILDGPVVANSSLGGLVNYTTTGVTVNASGNWWGFAAPAFGTILSGAIDYTPWCGLVGTYNNPGYTPNLSNLWVTSAGPQVGGVGRVQEGVNMVTGSTVNLAPGIYEEQVHITMNGLQLVGAGVGLTTIQSPAALPLTFTTGAVNHPIIFVDGATGVGISNLKVNGLGRGNANYRFVGIGVWNSGGSVTNVDVTNVRDTPFSGAQHGVAVYAYNNMGGPYTLNMTDVNLTGYQKTGAALSGNGLTVNLTRVTATGVGDTLTTAQNGIQISYGATGTVTQCAVSRHCYTGTGWAATGYLISQTTGTVNITGSTASGNLAGLYADDADVSFTGGQIDYGTSAKAEYGALAYNRSTARASTNHPLPSPVEEAYRPRSTVDANQVVSLTNVTLVGDGLVDAAGIYGFSVGDNLDMTVTGCDVHGWDYGMILYEYGGTISASVTGNKLTNHYNAYDNKPGPIAGRWAGNCYSDYALNSGFPLGQYDIDDVGNVDYNPNPNGCSNVDVYAPAYIGCATSGCPRDTLYYTLDLDSVVDQRIWVTLPAGFLADWSGLNYNFSAGTGWDPRFSFGMATKLAANGVEIHVMFNISGGGSTGNPALYVASLPIVNDTVAHCGHKAVQGDSAYSLLIGPLERRDLLVASATITVDCQAPVDTLAYYPSAPSCDAFGNAAQLVGKFRAKVSRGDALCNSQLDEAWLTVNGHTYTFFGANPSGDFEVIFPATGTISADTLWSWLIEGCNDLVLHAKDVECNESSVTLSNVGKDVTKPVLARTFTQPVCYNNEPRSPQYGGDLLDHELDIDANVGLGDCIAQSGELWFRYDGTLNTWPTTPFSLPVADYPDSLQALDLWAWMMTQVPSEASGNYTFWVIAKDCAGNMDSLSFLVCIDLRKPANAFAILDARPTGLGVWLKWAWTYNASEAVEAKIFRSVYTTDYPLYNAPWKWDEFDSDGDYEQNYYDAFDNWILVATLSSLYQTSAAYGVTHDPGGTYWYYAGNWDTLGTDDHEYRDVYRFVTFVKDVSGNWSQVSSYGAAVNADRSTNYWLGDFSMDVEDDYTGNTESGAVAGYDLSLFTISYFKGAGSGYDPKCDIGPETGFPIGENAIGKGIPMPDDSVNFWDLVPFSFNFYMTTYQGYVTMPSPVTPRLPANLDAQPVVSVCRTDADPSSTSDEFTVMVTLSGNSDNAVKGVEAHVTFDPAALEFVSAVSGDISVSEGGQLFAVARPVNGSNRVIGVAAAACGPTATLNGDLTLAVMTFRWKAGNNSQASLTLEAVRMFDAYGTVLNGAGSVLGVGAEHAVPTRYALYQNYPNPFNPSTQIRFDLKENGDVRLVIYNVMGQEVRTLLSTRMSAGQHVVAWDGTDQHGRTVGSGVYIYRLRAGSFVESRKMLLTR